MRKASTALAGGLLAAALAAGTLTAGAPAAHAQISDDVIRIGVMNDQSGLYADITGQGEVTAVRMAAEAMGGAIDGRKIEVIFADNQNKPDIGSNIARQWYDQEKVDLIIVGGASSVTLAVQAVAREKGRINIVSAAAASDHTNKACSPTAAHWTYDTTALANGTGKALVQEGGDSWFFLTADYAFGHALERETGEAVRAGGGKVLGSVRHPLNTPDFSSFLLQAQGSGAKIIGLANAGGDTINSIKQASEFGIVQAGQRLAGLLVFITDVHSLGLKTAQGLVITTAFYWDQNDETRAWAKSFMERMNGKAPTMVQAGSGSAALHYLRAVKAAGTDDASKVMAQMRATKINDFMTKDGWIREDGRVMRTMYLAQVKSPAESTGPFDYYKILRSIPAEEAFRSLDITECPHLKK